MKRRKRRNDVIKKGPAWRVNGVVRAWETIVVNGDWMHVECGVVIFDRLTDAGKDRGSQERAWPLEQPP